MLKNLSAFLVAGIGLALAGCVTTGTNPSASGSAKAAAAECVFPGSDKPAPIWVCDGPVEGMAVGAVGSAQKSEAGFDFMKQMAATAARVQLAQVLKVDIQNMIKQYAETTGAGSRETVDKVNSIVTKQVTEASLQGTRIFRSVVGPDGTIFVLVGMDDGVKQKNVETALKSSMNNDRAAWQQFRAQKAQDELAADIAKQRATPEKSKD